MTTFVSMANMSRAANASATPRPERLPQTLIHLLDGARSTAGFEAAEDLRRLRASKGLPRAQQDPAWGAFDEKFRAWRPAARLPDRLRQHDLTLRRELCRFHRKMVRPGKTAVNRGSAVPPRRLTRPVP